jgi:hypothetical protein
MEEKRKKELNERIEEILDKNVSPGGAWEDIQKLAEEEGKEEVYLALLENILDDLIENADNVKNFLKQVNYPAS